MRVLLEADCSDCSYRSVCHNFVQKIPSYTTLFATKLGMMVHNHDLVTMRVQVLGGIFVRTISSEPLNLSV